MTQPPPLIIKLPKYTLVQREDRGNLWYVRFSYKGQKLLCCQTKNRAHAKDKAEELIVEHITQVSKQFRASSDESLSFASERWLLSKYRDKAPRTIKDMRSRLKALLDSLGTDVTKDFTKKLLEDTYTTLRATRIYQPHYWKDLITAWMQFVDWMVEEGLISDEPSYFRNIPVPSKETFRKVDIIISNADLEKLLPEFEPMDREWIMLMRQTSMNPADIWELKKGNIILDDDPKSKTGLKLMKVRAKAKSMYEEHQQPLNKIAARLLRSRWEKLENLEDRIYGEAMTEDTEHKFTNNLGARWTVRYKKVFNGKPTKKLTVLRHSYITEAILNKVSIPSLKKWVGHSPGSSEIEWTYNHHKHTADELRG